MARRPQPSSFQSEVEVIGASNSVFGDLYHRFLWMPWWTALLGIVVFYLIINALFAGLYLLCGGIEQARPGSFLDAFYFSVQTLGTIGYGAMYPRSQAANALVTAESITGLLVTALATGLVFAKFARPSARAVFSRQVVIAPMDGVPTLMFRVGNERSNMILEATIRLTLMRTEHTAEGMTFYRMYDVKLTRERSAALSRSWTAMHPITPDSMLYGQTPQSLKQAEVELIVSLVGTDDTSLQLIHARHRYLDSEIIWGARHADILSERPDGKLVIDVRKFHELVPTVPIPDFPYPQPPEPPGIGE